MYLMYKWPFRSVPSLVKNQGKSFCKNLHSVQGSTFKKDRDQALIRKLKNTTILWNDGSLLSGFQCKVLASLVHFVACKVNQASKCITLDAREEAAIIPYQDSAFQFFFYHCLVSVLFTVPFLTEKKLFSYTYSFPAVSALFRGGF